MIHTLVSTHPPDGGATNVYGIRSPVTPAERAGPAVTVPAPSLVGVALGLLLAPTGPADTLLAQVPDPTAPSAPAHEETTTGTRGTAGEAAAFPLARRMPSMPVRWRPESFGEEPTAYGGSLVTAPVLEEWSGWRVVVLSGTIGAFVAAAYGAIAEFAGGLTGDDPPFGKTVLVGAAIGASAGAVFCLAAGCHWRRSTRPP